MPRHIAFIMDGNGRWAQKRGMPRSMGHKVGGQKTRTVIKHCADLGIKVLSLYAFSTENWNRPKEEIDDIFNYVREEVSNIDQFLEWNVRVTTMGYLLRFPEDLRTKLAEVVEKTKNNTGMVLNLCLNYGGRADIVQAINRILLSPLNKGGAAMKAALEQSSGWIEGLMTEQEFEKYLYGADLPSPDLIVRTSGEQRISNFMLWQMAYSEFLFIDPHWPDMSEKLVEHCIIEYQKRNRRFGKV